MNEQPIKSFSENNYKSPFYLIQSDGLNKRYVVSIGEKIRIRMLLAGFINKVVQFIDVKVRDLDDPENPVEYKGEIEKSVLHKLMTKHEEIIFYHGFHELMFRNSGVEII